VSTEESRLDQHWKQAKAPFWSTFGPPAFWLLLFFLLPLGVVWVYSFGSNIGLTDIAVTGTLDNYVRAFDPLYLAIFGKSLWFAALTTFLCLIVGFPVALAITFAPEKAKAWLLLLIMLPFWTNLLIRTYALMAVLRGEGYINTGLGWLGIDPLPLLHNNFAVVVGLVYVNLPFLVLPLYAALDRLDRSLLEASLDLGAGMKVMSRPA
jgi:spermidine/putrescine transport system permease protein